MNKQTVEHFTQHWIATWNARDVEGIVSHFAKKARFVSPVAAKRTGHREVVGRDALRAYWSIVHSFSTFAFTMDHIVWDQDRQELVIVYQRSIDGRLDRAAKLLRFNDKGQVTSGEAMYGAEIV